MKKESESGIESGSDSGSGSGSGNGRRNWKLKCNWESTEKWKWKEK